MQKPGGPPAQMQQWRPKDFPDSYHENLQAFRDRFFTQIICEIRDVGGEGWSADLERTRLVHAVNDEEHGCGTNPLTARLYFTSYFSQLFIEVDDFYTRKFATDRGVDETLRYIKGRSAQQPIRVKATAAEGRRVKIQVWHCIDDPDEYQMSHLVSKTKIVHGVVTGEALFLRDFFGA
jgi:hypothetical protein